MGDKQYAVLYTSQKSKKAKTWHDGTLKLPLNGSKAVLYDDKKSKLDSIHLRADEVVTGEQLESDRYFILVEELIKTTTADSSSSAANNAALTSGNSNTLPAPVNNANRRALRAGLKRKNTGFVPPRMVKQPRQDTCDDITASNDSSEFPNPATAWPSQHSFKQDRPPLQQPNRQDIFSLYAKNNVNDRVAISNEGSPKFESEVSSSFYGNFKPMDSNKHQEVVKSPWSTYGNVKLKSKQTSNATDSEGSSQSDVNNDSSHSSIFDNSEPNSVISVNRCDEIMPELENKHTNQYHNESQSTDMSVRGITEKTNHVQGKRTASQIMALLKPKSVTKENVGHVSPKSSPAARHDTIRNCIKSETIGDQRLSVQSTNNMTKDNTDISSAQSNNLSETRRNMSSNKKQLVQSADTMAENYKDILSHKHTSKHCSNRQITDDIGRNYEQASVSEKVPGQNMKNWEEVEHKQTFDESAYNHDSIGSCETHFDKNPVRCDAIPQKESVMMGNISNKIPENLGVKSNDLSLLGSSTGGLNNEHCVLRSMESENYSMKNGLSNSASAFPQSDKTECNNRETNSCLEMNKREKVSKINKKEEEKVEMNIKEEMVKEGEDKKEMNNQEQEEQDTDDENEEEEDDDDLGDPYFQISFSPLSQVTDSDDENTVTNDNTMVNKDSDPSNVNNENINSSTSEGLMKCETESNKESVSQKMSENCYKQHDTDFNVNHTDSAKVPDSQGSCLGTESNFRKSPGSQNLIQDNQNISFNYLESLNFSQDSLRAQSLNSQDNFNKISCAQPTKNMNIEKDCEDRFKINTFVNRTTTQHSDSSLPFGDVEYVSDSQSSQLSVEQTPFLTGNQTNLVSGLQLPFTKFKHSNNLDADKSCDREMEPNSNSNMADSEMNCYGNSNKAAEINGQISKDIYLDEDMILDNNNPKNKKLVDKVNNSQITDQVEKEILSIKNKRLLNDKDVSEEFYRDNSMDKSESQEIHSNVEDTEAQEHFSGQASTCSSNFSEVIPYQEKTEYITVDKDKNISHSLPNCESDLYHNDSSELMMENRFIQSFKDMSQNNIRNAASLSKNQGSVPRGHTQTHFKDVKQDYNKQQSSSVHSLPHPSEVFGVTDKHKVKPIMDKQDLSSVIHKKLGSYRIRGSVSGCSAKRTNSDPNYLSQSTCRNTSRDDPHFLQSQTACKIPSFLSSQSCRNTSTDPYFISSQNISRNSCAADASQSFQSFHSPSSGIKYPHQWTENYDDTSMYIDWNDGKPRLRDIEHLTNGPDKQISRSPLQFVPEFKTCVESPDLCQQVPCNEETGTFIDVHSEDPFTEFIKENNRHEENHTTLFSKEQPNGNFCPEKSRDFKNFYQHEKPCDKMKMSQFNSHKNTVDDNKTMFTDFKQQLDEEFTPNYTQTQFRQNVDDKHSSNNTKHEGRFRKALKSKPFDDPITHTSYNSYYFSPTKTPFNEQPSRHDHSDEKNEYFDSSLNLSLEIGTPQLAVEPSKEHKNVNCNDVNFGKSTVHMLRPPSFNQDTPETVYENSSRLNYNDVKSDYPHVSKNPLDGSPFSLNTSMDEELTDGNLFKNNANYDQSDKSCVYSNQSQHQFQCSGGSSNRLQSSNMCGDKKSFGNIRNYKTVSQAPADNHGNKSGDVTSKWGKYLPIDDGDDNDDDFDSLLNQSLDIGTPKLKPKIEPVKDVFMSSNNNNVKKSTNDLLRAPLLSELEVTETLESFSENVKTSVRHGTKYTKDLFHKGRDISKLIQYDKFCGDPVTDEDFLSSNESESLIFQTETISQDVIHGNDKGSLMQGFRTEKERQFKSPLMEKPTFGNDKGRNFGSPVIHQQEFGTRICGKFQSPVFNEPRLGQFENTVVPEQKFGTEKCRNVEKCRTFLSPVMDEPMFRTQKGRQFASPVLQDSSHLLTSSKRNLASELQFASQDEVERNPVPSRQVQIPVCFPSVAVYKNVLIAVLKEHLNIILFELSKQYHHTLAMIDTTGYGLQNTERKSGSEKSSNPACNCGAPSKIVQVKKDGANKGRFFYACNAARNVQCKFFQWADQSNKNKAKGNVSDSKIALNSGDSITTFFRSQHITLYADCTFLKKNVENIMHHFKKNVPDWVKRRSGISDTMDKKKMYVQLSKKDPSSMFAKDDLWIISHQLHFEPPSTFLARSTYYGPNSSNEVEIEPMAGFSASNWSNQSKCQCIHVGNISSELSYLQNIQENINPVSLPVLPNLLNRQTDIDAQQKTSTMKGFKAPLHQVSKNNLHTPDNLIVNTVDLAGDFIKRYHLNEDQSAAIRRVASMFCKGRQLDSDPILLIHGVFGAGKSYLLSVIVLFLVKVFELNASYTPGVPFDWKILISSTTNVAVDRILNGLLQLDFEDFVRVGSIKKIAKPVLPYSVHATGTDNQELKDLQEMLRSGDATPLEKHHIRQSIEKHRLGENKKKLSKVKVVGVTCAASAFSCLDSLTFPVVLIDESSQMTEPSSLLPIAKFGCNKLLLVGDPKQLDPAIQGSEATHDQGLEQTLFDRLTKLGYEPTVLRTQYRCHPVISNIANTLFYGGCLIDGISQEERLPLVDEFPTLCFYDVNCGKDCSDSAGSYYNQEEADFVVYLIQALICSGVEPCNIGVITVYKSQMYKIITTLGLTSSDMHKEVKSILVSTVDAFQGGERDVIILSCVRTNNVGFIDNEKRTNVALTRAKHHLLIVGNLSNLSKNNLWRSVIQQCKDFPGGIENSSHTRQRLQYIIDNVSQDSIPDINDTGSTTSKTKSKKTSRKNKTSRSSDLQNSSSPPMSLSAGSGTQQTDNRMDSEELFSSCSSEREISSSNKVTRKRKSRVLDPCLLDSDKENSEDEDFPKFG